MTPLTRSRSARRAAVPALAAALLAAVVLTGCSGGSDTPEKTPEDALAEAKTTLDETSGLHLELTSEHLPKDLTGLVAADGTLTRQPAFDGDIVVRALGMEPRVPVIAVDGEVHAQLPLTSGWQTIDPAEYGAPDPARLIATDGGLSDLLTSTTDLEAGESVRGGSDNSEVLTTYTGTIPSAAITQVFPSTVGDVAATYTLTDEGELRSAELAGDFYGEDAEITYTLDLDDYGLDQKITAP